MCRYSEAVYKPHYACFRCRKTFKRRLISDIEGGINPNREVKVAKCPECSETMADMGLDFESPKKSDLKAWNYIEQLYKSEITFHSCGCVGSGYVPRDSKAIIEYLQRVLNNYIEQRRFWLTRKEPQTKKEREVEIQQHWGVLHNIPREYIGGTKKTKDFETDKAIEYWNDLIKKAEERLNEHLSHQ